MTTFYVEIEIVGSKYYYVKAETKEEAEQIASEDFLLGDESQGQLSYKPTGVINSRNCIKTSFDTTLDQNLLDPKP